MQSSLSVVVPFPDSIHALHHSVHDCIVYHVERIIKPKYDISRIIGTGHQKDRGFTCPDRAVPQSKSWAIVKAHAGEPMLSSLVVRHSCDTKHIIHDAQP